MTNPQLRSKQNQQRVASGPRGALALLARLSHHVIPLALVAGALVATVVGFSTVSTAKTKYIPVSEIKPGMKGYGMTVFSGTKPTRFEVEVLSTLHNFKPNQDLIIVRTTHPRLKVARTVAGMSGSPIYLDGGRLAGAYAYGWYFGVEPIAGVTPIGNMLAVLKRKLPKAIAPNAARSLLPTKRRVSTKRSTSTTRAAHRFVGDPLKYDLEKHAQQMKQRSSAVLSGPGGSPVAGASTPVMVGGLHSGSLKVARQLLGPAGFDLLQAGGAGGKKKADPSARYVDGGVLTIQLVRGDVSLSGLGTVTHVKGKDVLAFGHPMMDGGFEKFPAALGTIHWIMATANRSFKIGEPTTPLGTLVNDRQAAVVVDTNITAPVFPASLKVDGALGAPKTQWNMEIAHDQFLSPTAVAVALGNALRTTTAERGDMTWRARSKLSIEGYGSIELIDFDSHAGRPVGPYTLYRSQLVRAIGSLLSNPWEEVRITGVETKFSVTHKREIMRLRGTQLLTPELDPGQPARIKLFLEHWRGKKTKKIIEVPLPKELAGRRVSISLSPGYRVTRTVPPPENLRDLINILPKMYYPGQSLVATYSLPGSGAAYQGQIATRLPPSALDTMRSSSQSISPRTFGSRRRVVIPLKMFLIGGDSVSVKIRDEKR